MTTDHQADAENLAHARGLIAEPLMPVKVEAQVRGVFGCQSVNMLGGNS